MGHFFESGIMQGPYDWTEWRLIKALKDNLSKEMTEKKCILQILWDWFRKASFGHMHHGHTIYTGFKMCNRIKCAFFLIRALHNVSTIRWNGQTGETIQSLNLGTVKDRFLCKKNCFLQFMIVVTFKTCTEMVSWIASFPITPIISYVFSKKVFLRVEL